MLKPHSRIGWLLACGAILGYSLGLAPAQVMAQEATSKPADSEPNLIKNGLFDGLDAECRPKGWRAYGHPGTELVIAVDSGPAGKKALKLTCTKFVPGFPDSHAMVLLNGSVELKKGQFYKLTWWAKGGRLPGESLPTVATAVDIVNSSSWKKQFGQAFQVFPSWRRYEQVFQAPDDLPAATSRLAFFMKETGVLLVADVSLVATAAPETRPQGTQWWPRISTKDATNLLPNSSFECETSGWGGFAPDLQGSGGCRTNLPMLPGEVDNTTAWHGRSSLRIHFDKDKPITLKTNYASEQARQLAVANVGWIPLAAGERYVFSCYLKADQANTPARMLVYQPGQEMPIPLASISATIGTDWKRVALQVRTNEATYVWLATGLDMSKSQAAAATLWLDSLQFEKGEKPSGYQPRATVESFVVAAAPGNIFTEPAAGMNLSVVACNAGDAAVTVKGKLSVTDFADREVFAQDVQLPVAAKATATAPLNGVLKGRRGFFRVAWRPADYPDGFTRTLRCALIDEYPNADSPFGMNRAYPWPVLNQLAKKGGLMWMRDWSPTWNHIESQQGQFDFSFSDERISAILAEKLNVLALLAESSAQWASATDLQAKVDKEIDKELARTGGPPPWSGWREYQRRRMLAGCAPKDTADFRNYVTRTVEHYQKQCRYFEIFNEPLDPDYSLSSRFGYKMNDYIGLLKAAFESAKAVNQDVQIIGGISTWPSNQRPREFIDQGGLQFCDVMNVHWYPDVATGAEAGEKDLAEIEAWMRAKGLKRPIWITEFGCYADDDPPFTPDYRIGDETMQRCQYASEREAAAGMVKYCALLFGHGATKIFFHAGASGPINAGAARGGADGAGVFFEYGGAPRKMYPALAALAGVLGADFKPAGSDNAGSFYTYWFRTGKGSLAVVWKNEYAEGAQEGKAVSLRLPAGVSAMDMMGNKLDGQVIEVADVPIYLTSVDEAVLGEMFGAGQE